MKRRQRGQKRSLVEAFTERLAEKLAEPRPFYETEIRYFDDIEVDTDADRFRRIRERQIEEYHRDQAKFKESFPLNGGRKKARRSKQRLARELSHGVQE